MQPQDTRTSLPASVSLHSLATRAGQGFLKGYVPQFWPSLFLFRRRHIHRQNYLMRARGQVLWKKAEPNDCNLIMRLQDSKKWWSYDLKQ